MDIIDDAKNLARVPYDRSVNIEATYARFCKTTEQLLNQRLVIEGIDHLNRLPLIMFNHDKAEKALKFAKEETCDLHLPFKSCIVADSIGIVVLKNAKVIYRENEDVLFKQFDSHFKEKGDEPPTECMMTNCVVYLCDPHFNMDMFAKAKALVFWSTKHLARVCDISEIQSFVINSDVASPIPPSMVARDIASSVGTAIDQIHYMTQPGNYVVEQSPRSTRDPAKTVKLIRAHERRRIIMLNPDEMKKIYIKKEQTSHASPLPHLRMGHWREYRDAKFIHKKGQRIWIEEIKVKAGEKWEFEGKTYRVMER